MQCEGGARLAGIGGTADKKALWHTACSGGGGGHGTILLEVINVTKYNMYEDTKWL